MVTVYKKRGENMDGSFGYQSGTTTMSKQKHNNSEATETAVFWLRNSAITYGVLSVGCLVSGIFTVYYASANFTWPFSSCSGLWTGVMAFVSFVVGFHAFKNYDVRDPSASKRLVTAYFALVITCITLGGLHLAYSATGYAYCVQEHVKDKRHVCLPEWKARLELTEGFNVAFGSILCLLSTVTTVYMSTGRRLMKLTGLTEHHPGVYGTCCNGNCICYSDC